MSEIVPSILAADFNHLGEQLQILKENGVKLLHIDVMDGMFVPSISFGMPVISSLRREQQFFFDVHLMIQEPERYIREFIDAGADNITFHVEACRDPQSMLDELKKYPVKRGITLRPGTSVEKLKPYLDQVDMVLVMSVEPGFGGQKLIKEMLDRIKYLEELRKKEGYSYLLEIDGGVTRENIQQVKACGTDWIVAGTAVFGGDIRENLSELKEEIQDAS